MEVAFRVVDQMVVLKNDQQKQQEVLTVGQMGVHQEAEKLARQEAVQKKAQEGVARKEA